MVLFTKSYAELSEAFVREKLGEVQAFGRLDIEEWLVGQCEAQTPDDVWHRFFNLRSFGQALAEGVDITSLLRENAEATPLSAATELEDEYASPLDDLAVVFSSVLQSGKVTLYRGKSCMIFDCGGQPIVLVMYEDDDRSICQATFLGSWHVINALFYTWKKGGPRAPLARIVLCDTLAKRIAQERIKAQSDFDSAVAVSADGTKIVQATSVVVYGDGEPRRYPASAFFTQKIILERDRKMSRTEASSQGGIDAYIDEFLDTLMARRHEQLLVTSRTWSVSVFVTHKKFCPDPLPAPLPEPAKA